MRLNDGHSMLKGRPLKLDVAQPPQNTNNGRRGSRQSLARSQSDSFREVDGRQFRGGRYTRRDSSGSSPQRQSSINSESSEPRQRPSLKLAPRTKPREDTNESSSSSLFGEGKKRDESEWERGRETRGPGRGGRGKGRGEDKQSGRGGRGKGKSDDKQNGRVGSSRGNLGGKEEPKKTQSGKEKPKKTQSAPKKEMDATPKLPIQVQPEAAKSATTKVQNKFAALNMDSDSD